MRLGEDKKHLFILGAVLASIPILWLPGVVAHDLSPMGMFRDSLFFILDLIQWEHVVVIGFIGIAITISGFIYTRKYWYLVLSVFSIVSSMMFYVLMAGIL